MQQAIGFVFDFDNLLLDTTRLKGDLGRLVHQSFPAISPELYEDCYAEYKVFHFGRTHMRSILKDAAAKAKCSDEETETLLHEWVLKLPYDEYVFPGARELIASHDPNLVFVFTKSEDEGYQRAKIDACHLGVRDDHIIITPWKTPEAFDALYQRVRECGITRVIAGSDEAIDLINGDTSAHKMGLYFEGVHHFYGSYRFNDIGEAQEQLGNRYHQAKDFRAFSHICGDRYHHLEGLRIPTEGMLVGRERI